MKKFTLITDKAVYDAVFQTNHWILIVKHTTTKIESTHIIKEQWNDSDLMRYISLIDNLFSTE